SGVATSGTLQGFGPFVRSSENESLLLLQALMGPMAIMTRLLAAVVAERGRAEAALVPVAAIVQSSDDAIIGKTLEGVVTSWNSGAERLYGYSAREVIGRPIGLIIPQELDGELPGILERLGRGERIDHYDAVRGTKDGRRIDVSQPGSPTLDAEARILGVSSLARDITHRKQAEG